MLNIVLGIYINYQGLFKINWFVFGYFFLVVLNAIYLSRIFMLRQSLVWITGLSIFFFLCHHIMSWIDIFGLEPETRQSISLLKQLKAELFELAMAVALSACIVFLSQLVKQPERFYEVE